MTNQTDSCQFLLARWILPISGPAEENACLCVDGDKIVSLISRKEFDALPDKTKSGRTIDYGDSVILPGLINLHTHLDYSNLKHLDNYSPFFDWINVLIGNSWQWDSQQWFDSAMAGAREIISSGTSTVADSSVSGAAARAVAHSGLRGVVGLELFGVIEEEADQVFAAWLAKHERFVTESEPEVKEAIASGRLRITIAPHTPYSVCPALIRKSLSWSQEQQLPLLIHVSESDAECRWIAAADKDLEKFLQAAFKRELPESELSWRGHGLSPVKHLESHDLLASNVLAAHLVQINEADIEALARHKVSAVHCPRSNSRLRNGVAPFAKLVNANIKMGLGTDSAASTDDLDLLAEARFAWDLHRAVDKSFGLSAEDALNYLTLGGATALNLHDFIGSLEAGKKADYAVFSLAHLPELARQRPFECLIYGGAKMKLLVVNGKELGHDDGYKANDRAKAFVSQVQN